MQQQVLDDNQSLCLLVDSILGEYTNRKWEMTVDKVKYAHDAIRQVSIDHFYALALNDRMPFFRLRKALPQVVDDVIEEEQRTVLPEAEEMEPPYFQPRYCITCSYFDDSRFLSHVWKIHYPIQYRNSRFGNERFASVKEVKDTSQYRQTKEKLSCGHY